jgi:hypothetical protein
VACQRGSVGAEARLPIRPIQPPVVINILVLLMLFSLVAVRSPSPHVSPKSIWGLGDKGNVGTWFELHHLIPLQKTKFFLCFRRRLEKRRCLYHATLEAMR